MSSSIDSQIESWYKITRNTNKDQFNNQFSESPILSAEKVSK